MNSIRLILPVLLVVVMITSGCRKEGCTDARAINKDSKAKKDNGSCLYRGKVVFWYNHDDAASFDSDNVNSLNIHLNAEKVGTMGVTTPLITQPDCGNPGALTIERDLGNNAFLNFVVTVLDQDGFPVFSGNITIEANSCLRVQLKQ